MIDNFELLRMVGIGSAFSVAALSGGTNHTAVMGKGYHLDVSRELTTSTHSFGIYNADAAKATLPPNAHGYIVYDLVGLDIATYAPNQVVKFGTFNEVGKDLISSDTFAFSASQPMIIAFSKELFSNSRLLSDFEERVLDETYMKSLKKEPSRPNRL